MIPGPHRTNAVSFLRSGLQTWAFCLAISALLAFMEPDRPYQVGLLYSLCIGTGCWLLSWVLRHALHRPTDPGGWPHDWRGGVLLVGSVGGGFLAGTAGADVLLGRSSWNGSGNLAGSIAITALAGVAIAYFFHSRGRGAYLEAAAREAARTAAESRLKLLEVQLEPHMLFNTLANLRVLVASDPARAQTMLDHLIAYLRATLGGSRAAWHPLADEFARLGDYLALMQVRMGPRLAYAFALPDALRDVPVPALLLQPLVENSIRHGLEPQVAGGRIDVRARCEGTGAAARLVLEVHDTGAGLGTPDATASPAAAALPGAGGFGSVQVRERLAAAYGPDATMELIATSAGGACATLRFPLQNHAAVLPQAPPAHPQPAGTDRP